MMRSLVLMAAVLLAAAPAALSAPLREGHAVLNGVDHYYCAIGEGEPFVVLHGGPGMYHDELLPFFMAFAEGRELIFYDQRGNGRSPMAVIDESTFNVDLLVADLDALREHLGYERINVIGHSWGGLLAMYYATAHPERVTRLITISSAPVNTELLIACYENQITRYTAEEWTQLQQMWNSEAWRSGDAEVHNEAMRLAESRLFHDPSLIDEYMAVAAFTPETAANAVALSDLSRDIKLSIHVQEDLGRISCPTLIIHSASDFIVPESATLAQSLISGAELVVLEGSGHYPHIEVPVALFAAMEDFIERTR